MLLVGFNIEIYYDARSYKCQICLSSVRNNYSFISICWYTDYTCVILQWVLKRVVL